MELGFSEEQDSLRATVRRLCADHAGGAAVRASEQSERGYSEELWGALAAIGVTAMAIDSAYGGLGMGCLDGAIVYEELGRSLVSVPLMDSACLSARLLQTCGSAEQRQSWLPGIAAGEKIVIPAWQETGCSGASRHWRCSARASAGGLSLSGEKVLVPFANSADALLVVLRNEQSLQLLMVPAQSVRLRRQPNHADQALFAVALEQAQVSLESNVATGDAVAAWEQAMLQAQIAVAAQAIGGALAMLEMATEYAKQRQQFGQPIGAFQAIAHYLVDRATEIEGARYLVYQAAWACDKGKPFTKLALMAKLQATAVFRRTTVTGVQVHGGMGFSEEADPQLYYRRAKHLQLMHWDPDYLEQRLATEILD